MHAHTLSNRKSLMRKELLSAVRIIPIMLNGSRCGHFERKSLIVRLQSSVVESDSRLPPPAGTPGGGRALA